MNDVLQWFNAVKRFRHNGTAVRKSRFRLWGRAKLASDQLQDLKFIATSGRQLEQLTQHAGWEALLDIKAYSQNLAQSKTLIPDYEERVRFRAACEWQAVQNLFDEVTRRVQRGKQAEAQLAKAVNPT